MNHLFINTETDLEVIQCGTCGVWHGIPSAMFNTCLKEGGFWTCPNGHSRGYSEGSVYKQLEKEKKRREWAENNAARLTKEAKHERQRAIGYKGQATKLKNRAAAGVCPCCNRTFKQLASHMKNKHPDFKVEHTGENK